MEQREGSVEKRITGSMFERTFQGKRVWLSGHTGFKGSWLAEWLLELGAEVRGYALAPDTEPSLFKELELERRLEHQVADVRDRQAVGRSIKEWQPDFVFHLAAQPLVRRSYEFPVETYETNVLGTVHVLEALRTLRSPCAAVLITTDKCYENLEHGLPYAEDAPLGGRDPYSSSKAMAEIAISAYRRSYFEKSSGTVRIASARAGNVVGGGDWAADRIVPDCVRALCSGADIPVRNLNATRPWQHVLEPLGGYLWHAVRLSQGGNVPSALNFGPRPECIRPVRDLVGEVVKHWPGGWREETQTQAVHEAMLLSLSIEKAESSLGWRPVWDFSRTIEKTMVWYRSFTQDGQSALSLTRSQIREYCADARLAGLAWTA